MVLDIEFGSFLDAHIGMLDDIGNRRESVYYFAPVEREDKPEFAGMEAQIFPMAMFALRKIMGVRGKSKEYIDELIDDLEDMYDEGFDENDMHRIWAVVGQKGPPPEQHGCDAD